MNGFDGHSCFSYRPRLEVFKCILPVTGGLVAIPTAAIPTLAFVPT